MLAVSHNYWLVAASLMVALMAGFTGLSLLKGASEMPINQRKKIIALAAIALGGGIWSMHFVAMLGLQLPVLFFYDAVVTLISALIAILVVGLALLILHFRRRDARSITLAGTLVGLGILAMHYVGMSGIQLCIPVYTPTGIAFSVVSSVGLSIATFWIAYGQRTHRNIILGTVFFGTAVFTVHFVAMAGTSFFVVENTGTTGALIGNELLALGVAISAFTICGAFLLTSVTFLPADASGGQLEPTGFGAIPSPAHRPTPLQKVPEPVQAVAVPYEKDGRTLFVERDEIAAVRAEGHYTYLYVDGEKLFCPWSISQAVKRLEGPSFVRAHRSYLINPRHVSGFERTKDNGVCYFEKISSLDKVPVSRSHLVDVRETLGLA